MNLWSDKLCCTAEPNWTLLYNQVIDIVWLHWMLICGRSDRLCLTQSPDYTSMHNRVIGHILMCGRRCTLCLTQSPDCTSCTVGLLYIWMIWDRSDRLCLTQPPDCTSMHNRVIRHILMCGRSCTLCLTQSHQCTIVSFNKRSLRCALWLKDMCCSKRQLHLVLYTQHENDEFKFYSKISRYVTFIAVPSLVPNCTIPWERCRMRDSVVYSWPWEKTGQVRLIVTLSSVRPWQL